MRRSLPPAVLFAAALWISGGISITAQQQDGAAQPQNAQSGAQADGGQAAPDAPQPQAGPQSQKKKNQKNGSNAASAADSSNTPASGQAQDQAQDQGEAPGQGAAQDGKNASTPAKPSSTAAGNPFPEDVSQRAAREDANAPDASAPSPAAPLQKPASAPAKPSSTAADNPFPEDVSRRAAGAEGNATPAGGTPESPQPPGANPSRSSGGAGSLNGGFDRGMQSAAVTDPARAKKDTQVGDFYLVQGDVQGAYARYKDAVASDPTNMNAVYGLAEAAMRLKKFPEAERNYELYLQVIPTGSKAKHALKQLGVLAGEK